MELLLLLFSRTRKPKRGLQCNGAAKFKVGRTALHLARRAGRNKNKNQKKKRGRDETLKFVKNAKYCTPAKKAQALTNRTLGRRRLAKLTLLAC
jgi:hypothetical protein